MEQRRAGEQSSTLLKSWRSHAELQQVSMRDCQRVLLPPITITLLQHCELSPPSGCLFKAKNLQLDGNCNQVSYGVPLYALNSVYISLDVCGRNRPISFELFVLQISDWISSLLSMRKSISLQSNVHAYINSSFLFNLKV